MLIMPNFVYFEKPLILFTLIGLTNYIGASKVDLLRECLLNPGRKYRHQPKSRWKWKRPGANQPVSRAYLPNRDDPAK